MQLEDLEKKLQSDLAEPPAWRSRPRSRGLKTVVALPLAVVVLALGLLAGTAIATLRSSPDGSQVAASPIASRPLASPAPTPGPTGPLFDPAGETPPPGEALIVGQVLDQITFVPVAGARVRLDPYGLDAVTDGQGYFQFRGLKVNGRCQWVTFTVVAPNHGRLRTIDNPLYPSRAVFQLFVEAHDADHFIGAPSGAIPPGDAFCTR